MLRFVKQGVTVPLSGVGTVEDARIFAPQPVVGPDGNLWLFYASSDSTIYRTSLSISNNNGFRTCNVRGVNRISSN